MTAAGLGCGSGITGAPSFRLWLALKPVARFPPGGRLPESVDVLVGELEPRSREKAL